MFFKPSFLVTGSSVMLPVNGNILLCCVVLCCYMCVTTAVVLTLSSAVLHIQIKQINLVINNIYSEIRYYPR